MILRQLLTRVLACAFVCALVGLGPIAAQDGPSTGGATQGTITLETSERPLDMVLQWISRRAGVNLVCNEPEQPRITIRLINVTWQEAVDQIARRYGFVVEKRSERIWELTRPPKVRMEFQGAQLSVILEALARQAGVNMVISDRVDASRRLTMRLNGVPWRDALDVIVRTTGYVWIEGDYNIIRIVHADDVQRDLQTRVYRLNYADGTRAKDTIGVALSADGRVEYDVRTNSLIMTDTSVHLDSAFRLLREVDQRTQQVQIEMKFIEFNTVEASRIGFSGGLDMDIAGIGPLSANFFPFSSFPGLGGVEGGALDSSLERSGPVPSNTKLISGGLAFEALNTLGSTELIQTPTILTLNNEEALIEIVREIRFAEQTVTREDGQTVRSLAEARTSPVRDGIVIRVQPHITNDGYVSMNLRAEDRNNEFRTFQVGQDSIELPQVSLKNIRTKIMVADGETAVIGGILTNRIGEQNNRVPFLGSIPVLGHLFRGKSDSVEQRNMTIFITPRVVQMGDRDDLEDAKLRLRERLSGLSLRPENDERDFEAGGP